MVMPSFIVSRTRVSLVAMPRGSLTCCRLSSISDIQILFYLICGSAAVLAQALPKTGSEIPMIGASGEYLFFSFR